MSESNKFIFKKYDANASINRRTAIITIAKAGLFSILGARLAYLQIVDKDKYEILSDNNRITHRLIEPQRGIIYDLQGKPLAINRQRYEVVIIREETSDYIKSIENLKNILPDVNIDTEKLYSEIKKTKKFIPIKVLDDLSWDQFSRLNANIHKVDGLYPQIGFKRYYTSGQSHSHIIGYTAPLDKKEKDTNTLADLSSAKSLVNVINNIPLPDLIVANAGIGITGSVGKNNREHITDASYLMFGGVIELIEYYLPQMKIRNSGRVVIISSIGALIPMPKSSIYAAVKSGVYAYGRSLNSELKGNNVSVTVSLPGYVKTNIHKRAGLQHLTKKIPNWMWVSAEQVVKETESASIKGSCGLKQ